MLRFNHFSGILEFWNIHLESKGLTVNMDKNWVMLSSVLLYFLINSRKWLCGA